MIVSTKDIADIFGVTRQAVQQWYKAGCPKQGRGQWDLKTVLEWWLLNIYSEKSLTDDEDLAAAKRRYWSSKADKEKMAVDQQRGDLVPKAEIQRRWVQRILEFKTAAYETGSKMTPIFLPIKQKIILPVTFRTYKQL
jgi:phage terminase Nu1 subunit (DNA packaging protein)